MDPELKERWNRMWVQAEEFEAVDKIEEARARARQAQQDVRRAHDAATDPVVQKEIERFLRRANRFVERYDALYEEWERRVRQRHAQFLKREEEAYQGPLPVPPLGRE